MRTMTSDLPSEQMCERTVQNYKLEGLCLHRGQGLNLEKEVPSISFPRSPRPSFLFMATEQVRPSWAQRGEGP